MRWMILVLLTLLAGANVQAAEPSWGRGTAVPKQSDFIPKLKSGEAYSERYTFNIPLDGGGDVYMDFTVSNLGWGDHKGVTTARVRLPGKKAYTYKAELDEDDWSFDRKVLKIRMGKSTLEADGEGYRLRHDGDVRIDLKLENTVPAWRPGSGKIKVGGETFELALMSPKARVSGRIGMAGTWYPVSSANGMGDWSMSTIAPYDLANRFSRFKAYHDGMMVTWREIRTTEDLGGKSVVWVLVVKDGEVLFESAAAKLTASAEFTDKTSGYSVPRVFKIQGRDNGQTLSLTVRATRVTVRDLLADYGSVARTIAGTLTNPYQFNSEASFTLKLDGDESTTVTGSGPLGIDILN
ncbi:MAG: hypothetical protein R3E66_13460 [bacterium]